MIGLILYTDLFCKYIRSLFIAKIFSHSFKRIPTFFNEIIENLVDLLESRMPQIPSIHMLAKHMVINIKSVK